eukprot:TRINITY_DN28953_c0_g1_i3.p1 TRINITY_DN28953_c0_g1~~TRINITY_DN28953_c0_g1_i3.p1  ORF type:complete len:276 (+),score=30.12 TRINITY_DN28953_c0_g1_i3:71-898(+)
MAASDAEVQPEIKRRRRTSSPGLAALLRASAAAAPCPDSRSRLLEAADGRGVVPSSEHVEDLIRSCDDQGSGDSDPTRAAAAAVAFAAAGGAAALTRSQPEQLAALRAVDAAVICAIRHLDEAGSALMTAAAAVGQRLHCTLPPPPPLPQPAAALSVPPPSLQEGQRQPLRELSDPPPLRGAPSPAAVCLTAVQKWAALRWDWAHLNAVAGHRTVPVEVGAYMDSAGAARVPLGRLLRRIVDPGCDAAGALGADAERAGPWYMAQHALMLRAAGA